MLTVAQLCRALELLSDAGKGNWLMVDFDPFEHTVSIDPEENYETDKTVVEKISYV